MRFFLRWFTRNWADTDEPGDPAIRPVDLALSVAAAVHRLEQVIGTMPRWQVAAADAAAGTLHATRRTRTGFIDDIHMRLEGTPAGCRVHARSQARLGKADFGQNRRNLIELFGRLTSRS